MKRLVVFILILLILLSVRFIWYFKRSPVHKVDKQVQLEHTFLNEPKITGHTQSFWVGDIYVLTSSIPQYHYSDKVKITGRISPLPIKKSDQNLSQKKQILSLYMPKIELIENKNPVLSLTSLIRQRVENSFSTTLTRDEAGLMLGVVLGIKSGISKEYYEKIQKSGVVHIIAASGMNVAILASFFFFFFNSFFGRKIGLIGTLACIGLYTVLSGLNPPILRASIMASLCFTAQIFGRQITSLLILLIAAFLMLIIDPSLYQDVGFQLSFAATSGILLIKPLLDHFYPSLRLLKFLKDDFSTTISAQITTLPILLVTFSTFALHSIIINLLILWTIPILMCLGIIASVISIVSHDLAKPFLYLSYPLLLYFKFIIENLSNFLPQLEINGIPISLILGYYLVIGSVVLKASKK